MNHEPLIIDDLVELTLAAIPAYRVDGPGMYRRFLDPPREASPSTGNAYGVSNVANLYYTLNRPPREPDDRRRLIEGMLELQDPDTGLYHSEPIHAYPTPAHCLAALELFDALPRHPLAAMRRYATPDGIVALLESLDWTGSPWNQSHRGAGVYASLKLAHPFEPRAEQVWENAYFDWLHEQTDPATGLIRRGCLPADRPSSRPLHEHMAGTFHYVVNMQSARRSRPTTLARAWPAGWISSRWTGSIVWPAPAISVATVSTRRGRR